ncbi:MAG: alpha/beta hydrolase-fold protein [Bryobacteraceae bacterium]
MRSLKILACGLTLIAAAWAQTYSAGPQVVTFFSEIDDTDQPYGLYVPHDYDGSKKYPLVVSLHGAGSNHRLNLRRVFGRGNSSGETDAEATRYFPPLRNVDYVVACPLARGTMGYQGIAEHDVYDMIADVKKRFSIDEDRVYLTGLSMGGGGALWLGLTRPDLWAAVAPVCAAAPEQARDLTGNALNLPMHLFHGSIDPVVPVGSSRRWQHDLLELGCSVEYTEYPNVRHNSWESAYRNGALFDLLQQFRRNRFPRHVRFATTHYKYASAYWTHLDGITPGTLAEIEAELSGKDVVTVHTKNVNGFTLNLNDRPLAIVIDGEKIKPRQAISFLKTASGWTAGRYSPPSGFKRQDREGPISEAVAARHIYVYGSGGFPTPEELGSRRHQAENAAEWSTARSRLLLSLRAVQDKKVRPRDIESANLVLLGTKETNTLIAHYAAQLPIALNPSAADYGLVFIYPAGSHYLLINSGLPWWTGADEAKRGGWSFVPEKLRVLQTLGDFILFKGSLENVIAEGIFTPDWKLPPEAAQRMRASGAVEIR